MGNPQETHREVIKVLLVSLRYGGLWSFQDNSTVIMKIAYGVYSTMMTSLMWILVGTLLADLFSNSEDLLIITDDGCYLAGLSVIVFKLLMFRIRREEIVKLMSEIYDPIDTLAKCSDEGVMISVKVTTFWDQLQVYSFNTMGVFLVIAVVVLVPTDNGTLPIRAKYPFDSMIEPMHTVAFALQAGAVATGILGILCMDGLVISFIRFITLQLEILASNYRHCAMEFPRCGLISSSRKLRNSEARIESFVPFIPREAESEDDSFVKRFKICIKHHERLMNLVDSMNAIFGSSMFCQLVASSTMICLTGFQAALGTGGNADFVKFALYCGAAFSQLFLWCFMGNLLLHEGLTIASSQWQSGWESENYSEIAHLLIISMTRGGKTFELKAINFFSISMETFIMILRASYSFFTLLTEVKLEEPNFGA